MNIKKLKAMAELWVLASATAVVALYNSGVTDPKTLLNAFAAGLLAPAAQFLNPKSTTYGFGSKK